MEFINQHTKGKENWGTYLLTISISLFSFLIGNFIAVALLMSLGLNPANPSAGGNKHLTLAIMILPFFFFLAGVFIGIKFIHKRPILSVLTARSKFDWKRYAFGFGVWFIILILVLFVSIALGADIRWNFNSETFTSLLLIVLILPFQTAAEDVFFRGFLFQAFGKWWKHGGISLLVPAILFGLMHAGNPEVELLGLQLLVFYIGSGIFLGLISHMDDGLELGMGYHAANNIFAALILTNNWQVFQTDALYMDHTPPGFGWDAILTLLILQPLMILLFARVYKWKNWKEKLFNRTQL